MLVSSVFRRIVFDSLHRKLKTWGTVNLLVFHNVSYWIAQNRITNRKRMKTQDRIVVANHPPKCFWVVRTERTSKNKKGRAGFLLQLLEMENNKKRK